MRNSPFNLCIAFLASFLMNFVTPAFSSPTPTPTTTTIPTPTVTATTTTTVSATPTPPTTLEPTPVLDVLILGTVVNAVTTAPIPGATVSTDTGGYSATTDATGSYVISYIAAGDYIVTASATGYESSSRPVALIEGEVTEANFALLPIQPTPPPTTPTATPVPTPIFEEPEYIEISPTSLKLKKRQSSEVIVTLLGADGIIVGSETITATINKSGNKRISISSTSASTDENGQAKFTITAKNKTGNARITFKAGNVKKSMSVRVRRR